MMIWLIPIYGIYGAAISLLASTVARLLFVCIGFKLFLKTSAPNLLSRMAGYQVSFWSNSRNLPGACPMTTSTYPRPLDFAPRPYQNEHKLQTHGALAVLIIIPTLCILTNQAGILRVVFPVLTLGVGGILLWSSKPLYVGLVFWLWFITPFSRVWRITRADGLRQAPLRSRLMPLRQYPQFLFSPRFHRLANLEDTPLYLRARGDRLWIYPRNHLSAPLQCSARACELAGSDYLRVIYL